MPHGVELTAYAHDLDITVATNNILELNLKANSALNRISDWMTDHGLQLAPQKTEAIVMREPYKREAIDVRLMGNQIMIKKALTYLGVVIDSEAYFGRHVEVVIEKTDRRTAALSRIMPSIGGPGDKKRRILWGVVQSILLYAAPIWIKVLRIDRYRGLLVAAQKKVLLRLGYAYRTVSAAAIQVVTRIPPTDLLITERTRTWNEGPNPLGKNETRGETIRRWQTRWEETGQWTKRLIQHIPTWLKCAHRKINYWTTQFFTEHGSFRTFTKRMGKDCIDQCRYYEAMDTSEHTVFGCPRWEGSRIRKWGYRRGLPTAENIMEAMMSSKEEGCCIAGGINEIISTKKKEERDFQSGHPPPLPQQPVDGWT